MVHDENAALRMIRSRRCMMFALLLICCVAGGCGRPRSDPPPIIVAQKPVLCRNAPSASSLVMLPTPFAVVQDATGIWWIAMDARSYEALSRNIESLRLALNEARHTIAYYENCVRDADGSH